MLVFPRPVVWLLSGLVFALVVSTARAETSVTLRPEAMVVGPVIRLSAVANLEGPGAAELGITPVRVAAEPGPQEISLDEVRAALAAAGTNLGHLRLRGVARCAVVVKAPPANASVAFASPAQARPLGVQARPLSVASVAAGPAAGPADVFAPGPLPPVSTLAPTPADAVAGAAGAAGASGARPLGDLVRARLADWLGLQEAEAASLRVSSDDADADLLRLAVAAGGGFRVEPLGRPRLGRVSLRIHERAPDGGVTLHSVSLQLEREVLAVVATSPVRRGDTFSAANVALERTWLGRQPAHVDAPLDSLDGVLGSLAEVTLLPGTLLVPGHLARPSLVRRGASVTVRVMAGAVELVAEGVAEADAALGESVTVRLGQTRGRDARTVTAVVSGLGEVSVHQL